MIIAVDFDGTLCTDKYPCIGEPNLKLLDMLRFMQSAYQYKIILWTCRTGAYLREAVEWCDRHGLVFDAVNANLPEIQKQWGGDTRKVFADIYIDDKMKPPVW